MGIAFPPPISRRCLCFNKRVPRIVVIGSANIDLTTFTDQFRAPAKRFSDAIFARLRGKGANQAVAARNCGGDVTMIARVGDDMFGDATIQNLNPSASIPPTCALRPAFRPVLRRFLSKVRAKIAS